MLYDISSCVGLCPLSGSRLPLKQQAIQGGPASEHSAETIALGLTTVLSSLCEKAVLTALWKKIKGKKSPTVVTVPKKYKETNPDARI